MKTPCKDCERRKLLCLGSCKEYQDWKKKYEAARDARRQREDYRIPIEMSREYWRTLRYSNRRGNR